VVEEGSGIAEGKGPEALTSSIQKMMEDLS
jgi:hypothetical protein